MWILKKLIMLKMRMERKTEHRKCWGISKRPIDENHKRKRVANLTGLSLERAEGIYKIMGEQ